MRIPKMAAIGKGVDLTALAAQAKRKGTDNIPSKSKLFGDQSNDEAERTASANFGASGTTQTPEVTNQTSVVKASINDDWWRVHPMQDTTTTT